METYILKSKYRLKIILVALISIYICAVFFLLAFIFPVQERSLAPLSFLFCILVLTIISQQKTIKKALFYKMGIARLDIEREMLIVWNWEEKNSCVIPLQDLVIDVYHEIYMYYCMEDCDKEYLTGCRHFENKVSTTEEMIRISVGEVVLSTKDAYINSIIRFLDELHELSSKNIITVSESYQYFDYRISQGEAD